MALGAEVCACNQKIITTMFGDNASWIYGAIPSILSPFKPPVFFTPPQQMALGAKD
jgi:hypothetical protein